MKKALLIVTLLVSPGVFSATSPDVDSPKSSTQARKRKHKKKKPQPQATATSQQPEKLSGSAVQEAEQQARQTRQNELKNNVNAGASSTSKGNNASTVYPRSADPDVTDSYNSENRLGAKVKEPIVHGNDKTREREASTGSTAADSLSGSSSLPKDRDDTSK